jgi:hypothetical protein
MNRSAIAASAAVATFIAIGPGAGSASTPTFEFGLQLSSTTPARPTGLTFRTRYNNPSDPSGKPSPLRKSVIQAPSGTVFDGHAVPICTASDSQLMMDGPSACEDGSRVGTGTVVVITGCGAPVDPANLDVDLFNSGDGITELITEHASGARITVGHAKFTAPNTITETPSPNPGCPPSGETSVHQVDFHFNAVRGTTGAAFITTPRSCPASRVWVSKASATLADGNTYTATSTSPCTPSSRPKHHRHRHRHHRHRKHPR